MDTATLATQIDLVKKARATGLFTTLDSTAGPHALGVIWVAGADAASFLHSQLTNEVNALKPGEGNLSARVNRAGQILRYFSLHRLPTGFQQSGFMLILERDGVKPLLADLEKFALADDVLLEDISERLSVSALQGPAAPEIAEATFGPFGSEHWTDLTENSVRALDGGGLAFVRSLTGDPGFIIAFPAGSSRASELRERLLRESQSRGRALLDLGGPDKNAVLDILRIEAGIARIGVDAQENKCVLPETGMEQHLVSYSKGCYLGQEVIARIRTYGSVSNVLRGLILEGTDVGSSPEAWNTALQRLPERGADLFLDDDKKVGHIASHAVSPVLEAPVAFAFLDRTHRTPGTKLKLKGEGGGVVNARVVLLPFYHAADLKSRVTFLHDRAIRFFAEEKDDKAIELLEEALRLDPAFADGYEALGVILGRSGKFHEAIDIFKRLEEVAPNEPMVHTNLSLYYMKIGDKTLAEEEKAKATIKQFSRFGALKKDEKLAAEAAAKARADAERKKQMFSEVIEIDPDDPLALFGLGGALSILGEWDAAEKVLARACAVQKDNSAAYLARGKALEATNRNAEAVDVYRQGMAVASKKGDLMPLKEMERRVLLIEPTIKSVERGT